jgi:hypothetical protein
MQATNTATSPSSPTDFSPEFAEWLINAKEDAARHQRRIVKASFMIVIATVLFLLKEQPEWVASLLGMADSVVAR